MGSGRKPKRPKADVIAHPSALPQHSTVVPPTTNEPSPVEEFDAPDDLTAEERAVWLKQSPHAFKARTLTRGTAMAFERYCKVVVLERNEAKSSGVGGPNHRGLLRQLQGYELYFLLMPQGKPMTEAPAAPVPVADENDAFFGDSRGRA
jgi:hypothetical protein